MPTPSHPFLEGRFTPWVNAQESLQHPVLFVTNVDKMAAAFKDPAGRFLLYRVQFGLILALQQFNHRRFTIEEILNERIH